MRIAVTVVRVAALAAASIVAAAAVALALERPEAMDFVPLYAAARLVATGQGTAILDPAAIIATEREFAAQAAIPLFVHPPAVSLLLAPLGALPFGIAFAAMAFLDALLVIASIAFLARRSGGLRPLALAILAIAPPAALAVAHGQTSPLVLLLVTLSMHLPPRWSGLALGLTVVRPQTAPLLLLAGIADRGRRAWTIAGAATVGVASMAVVGLDGSIRYLSLLGSAADWSVTGAYGLGASIGWAGLGLALDAAGFAVAASAVSLVAGAIVTLRAERAERAQVAAVWSLLASPHVLMHDALLAYPALLRVARSAAPWDAVAAMTWMTHLAVVPAAVLWSLGLAAAAGRAVLRSATFRSAPDGRRAAAR